MKSERMKRLEAAYDVKGILTSAMQWLYYIPSLIVYIIAIIVSFLMLSNNNPLVKIFGILGLVISTALYFMFPALLKSWLEDTGPGEK